MVYSKVTWVEGGKENRLWLSSSKTIVKLMWQVSRHVILYRIYLGAEVSCIEMHKEQSRLTDTPNCRLIVNKERRRELVERHGPRGDDVDVADSSYCTRHSGWRSWKTHDSDQLDIKCSRQSSLVDI